MAYKGGTSIFSETSGLYGKRAEEAKKKKEQRDKPAEQPAPQRAAIAPQQAVTRGGGMGVQVGGRPQPPKPEAEGENRLSAAGQKLGGALAKPAGNLASQIFQGSPTGEQLSQPAMQQQRASERMDFTPALNIPPSASGIGVPAPGGLMGPGTTFSMPSGPGIGVMNPNYIPPDTTFTMPTSGVGIAPSSSGALGDVGAGAGQAAEGAAGNVGSTLGGIDWSSVLGSGIGAIGGAIPSLIKTFAMDKNASPEEQAAWNIGTALASPAAAVGGAAAGGAAAGAASGAGAGAGAASAASGALAAAPVAIPGIIMAVTMALEDMARQKTVKQGLSKLKAYEATQPQVAQEQRDAAQAIVNKLAPGMDPSLAAQVADEAYNTFNQNRETQGEFLSGGGGPMKGFRITGAGLPHGPFGGPAVFNTQAENDLLRSYVQAADLAARGGMQVDPKFTPTELIQAFRPDLFEQYHNYDVLKGPLAGLDPTNPQPATGPYAGLVQKFQESGYNTDELPNIGSEYGLGTSNPLTQLGPQNTSLYGPNIGWDPNFLAQVQGLHPGNYGDLLFPQAQANSNAAPASGEVGSVGQGGDTASGVGKLQPRNLLTGGMNIPRPESDAREAFGMRRPLGAPGQQQPVGQTGQGPQAPTPGTSGAEAPPYGTRPGFAQAPGGNIGTGGLQVSAPFGLGSGRPNRGGGM